MQIHLGGRSRISEGMEEPAGRGPSDEVTLANCKVTGCVCANSEQHQLALRAVSEMGNASNGQAFVRQLKRRSRAAASTGGGSATPGGFKQAAQCRGLGLSQFNLLAKRERSPGSMNVMKFCTEIAAAAAFSSQ